MVNRDCELAEFSYKYYIRWPTHIQANGKQTRPAEFKEDEAVTSANSFHVHNIKYTQTLYVTQNCSETSTWESVLYHTEGIKILNRDVKLFFLLLFI